MTDTSTQQTPPPRGGGFIDESLERLRGVGIHRDTGRRWFGGVCAGIAGRFDVDPLLIRAAAIALTIAGGIGIPIYLALWLLLPDQHGVILAERSLRHGDAWATVLAVVTAVVVVGGLLSIGAGGDPWGGSWWLLIPVGIVVWVLANRSRATPPGPWAAQTATPPPPPPGGTPMSTPPSSYATPTGGPAPTTTSAPYGQGPTGPTPYQAPYETPYGQTPYGQAPYGQAAHPQGPYGGAPVPPAPPRPLTPPPPPAPRRRRPSGFVGLVSLGLVIALVGLGVALAGPVGFPGEPVVLGFVIALAAVSAIVLGLGLTGRASGFSGFLVIALGLVTAGTVAALHVPVGGGVGDRVWAPAMGTLPVSYDLGLGNARLDLTGLATLTPAGGGPESVDVNLGAGDLVIVVPDGLDVRFENQIGAGDLRHEVHTTDGGTDVVESRSGTDVTYDTEVGGVTPDLVVTTDIGVGSLTIIEEN